MRRIPIASLVPCALVAACAGEPLEPATRGAPEIASATVAPNAGNVLSAVATVAARRADSVAVRFRLADGGVPLEDATPAVPVRDGLATVPVLGLYAERAYEARVIAFGAGGTAATGWMRFTTGALPPDLPRYTASGTDPSPGHVAFAAGRYGLVIDNTGRVVWYHRFPTGPGLNFMAQPNGRWVARPPGPGPAGTAPWIEIDVLGAVTRRLDCADGLSPRFHDLIAEPDGGYWILCDETRTMDLTAIGGVAQARVTGTGVQHVGPAGHLRFSWSPFDHLQLTDVDVAVRAAPDVNWTHGNALDHDADGNLLVSFRNLNEVTKIDVRTGAVLWRFGGLRNQFALDGATSAFGHQHSVRVLGAGEIALLDNVGDPLASAVERWRVDPATGTARLVHSWRSSPAVRTDIGGSVQPLPGGRTLVSFGTAGRVEEYDADGVVRWRIDGTPGYVFRAQRILSLYHPGLGLAR